MQREVEYILAVAEEGSISRAAERLYVGQPAISKTIAAVEEMVGFKLFIRERTGMIPTEAGEVYLMYARRVRDIEAEMHRRLTGMQKQEMVRLNIAMTLNAVSLSVMEIDKQIKEKVNGYELQIDNVLSKDILEGIRTGKYQYAVCPHRILIGEGDIQEEPLFANGWIFITPKDCIPTGILEQEKTGRDPYILSSTVLNYPLILQEESTNVRKEINELLDLGNRPSFRGKMQVANSLLAIESVQDGLGCAIISDTFRVYLDEKMVNICRLKTDWEVVSSLAYLKGRRIPSEERHCLDVLGEILRENNNRVRR
ncbi:MAG: LysR family transcriptional regulator [Solobacterium sp.]|nr:LysR family transcriptional regulator [Solobacterium sp.]